MKIVITDTNILFDVIKIGALPEFFSLDYEICTTVFVMQEILPSPQKEMVETFIRAKKLIVYDFSAEEIEEVQNFNTGRDLKRFTDKTVIWKSLQLNCPMLTGYQRMREVAEKMNIEVHGSIWIIDELVTKTLISSEKAILLLEQLLLTNSRLPRDEIEKRINKYDYR
jgi:predicted nucleic acid-binding protein